MVGVDEFINIELYDGNLKKLALFLGKERLVSSSFNTAFYFVKTNFMGQTKLDKKQENIVKADNPKGKNHKGDTERSSDQGRKSASGGSTQTNNQGQRKSV